MAKKVLIVEDEKPLARALEFTHAGFETRTAHDGEDGLAVLEKEKFDLILCDLVMPKVDGFQVLQLLKDKKIRVPVIVLTNLDLQHRSHCILRLKALSCRVEHLRRATLGEKLPLKV